MKKKDPSIYNAEKKFFDKNLQPTLPKKSTKPEASFTLRDYERKLILEKGGRMSDDEDVPPKTFLEEQEELKKNFKAVVPDSDSDTEEILKIRPKSDAQRVKSVNQILLVPFSYQLKFTLGKRRGRIQGMVER